MKVLTGASAIILMVSVGSLDSAGAWWLLPLAAGACSLGVLFVTCGRLGLFSDGRAAHEERAEACEVIPIHRGSDPGLRGPAQAELPPSSMNSTVQSSRSM